MSTDLAQSRAFLARARADYAPEQIKLIKSTVAKGATDAELAMFLELSARYGLDPFAKEIWCVPGGSRNGERKDMLVMVGRDGLRKIARQHGANVSCDVVRENDDFQAQHLPDGSVNVAHAYGKPADRGEIVGAWARVSIDGRTEGYFFAPLKEYRPRSEGKLKYSPWGSQESVMILAAAERQALRMALPLSGVLAQGETDRNDEVAEGLPEAEEDPVEVVARLVPDPTTRARLTSALDGLRRFGGEVPSAAVLQMRLDGVDDEGQEQVAEAFELEAERAAEPAEAEVVGEES